MNPAVIQARSARRSQTALRKLMPGNQTLGPAVLRTFASEQLERLRQLIRETQECVFDPRFRSSAAEKRYFTDQSVLDLPKPQRGRKSQSRQTLTAQQESELFLRFNYIRFRMMRILRIYQGRRLSVAAARELLKWDRAALRVRDMIVEANMGLVPAMLERLRVTGIDFGELISEGQLALLRSVDKFDCARGFKFSTYACRAILTSMTRAVARMQQQRRRFPAEYDPEMQPSDHVERERTAAESDCVSELADIWSQNSAALSKVERQVLRERFGFGRQRANTGPAPEKTLSEVAELFGLTKERIRQIQNQALAKLRSILEHRVFAA
jgi:RNA polymerase sigma factor (sigma-70 family)